MSDEVKKLATYMLVSNELLADARAMTPMFGPDERTPEQRAADEKRAADHRAEQRRAEAAQLAQHAERMATATGLLRAILELHAPRQWQQLGGLYCDGCDSEGYESEAPAFPCRTYELAVGDGTGAAE